MIVISASRVWAHAVGVSRGVYRFEPAVLVGTLTFARAELAALAPKADINGNGLIDDAELAGDFRAALADFVIEATSPAGHASTQTCLWTSISAQIVEGDGVALRAEAPCSLQGKVRLRVEAFGRLAHGHRHIAHIDGRVQQDGLLFLAQPAMDFLLTDGKNTSDPPRSQVGLAGFLRLGLEHILTGWDHLLFLLGLVLSLPTFRRVALVATSFTVAHSISLALASFGVFVPSPRWIEPLVALSIIWIGIENIWYPKADRLRVSFPFGLVHGFAFASVLVEIALPRQDLARALIGFNLGVECGQLAVLAVSLPILSWLRQQGHWTKRIQWVANSLVITAGLVLFVMRVVSP